ncbi:MAG: histidine--tRNA ligase [Actinomycetota bacterium]|nr:histidine--tRNA ligase [Actinomycetota bacterium]
MKAPRGTSDYLPERAAVVHWLDRRAGEVFGRYQYRRIITPTFEDTALFTRSIGEASDIVRKEMYTFVDRGDRSLTLRPEATAPVVRAFIEHNLGAGSLPVKLYYFANMFRYERPQAGRYREFWQLGVEALGSAEPAIDAEAIALAMEYLSSIGIDGATLKIGSMGDENCRPAYMETLRAALAGKAENLCEDCRQRLALNPLRVFDCKNPACRAALAEAPKMIDNLCGDCRAHFDAVGALLGQIGIDFEIDPMLVRGFDYYTSTTFEIQSANLGAQNALGGGGRYDRLVADYGGKPTPAVGFAFGIERLIMALPAAGAHNAEAVQSTDVFIAVIDDKDRPLAFKTAVEMRRLGLTVEIDYMGRSLRSQMKLADKLQAVSVVVFGPDELARGKVTVRNLASGEEKTTGLKNLLASASKGFK